MKILNISQCDWANFQYENMKALRSVELDCDSVVMERHPFYDKQSVMMQSVSGLLLLIKRYDVIQFFHDNIGLLEAILPAINHRKLICYHTSTYYRTNHARVNKIMNTSCVYRHVACMPEFMAMCPGAVYMVGAVDTDTIIPLPTAPMLPVKFAHYPSNSTVKGSENIYKICQELDVNLTYAAYSVPHDQQLERMAACDVYIEMFTRKDGAGNIYGNFGITALEAAAMGKVVITNGRDCKVYYDTYGQLPFVIADDEAEFRKQVALFDVSPHLVTHIGSKTRTAMVERHSYKATGECFLKYVL